MTGHKTMSKSCQHLALCLYSNQQNTETRLVSVKEGHPKGKKKNIDDKKRSTDMEDTPFTFFGCHTITLLAPLSVGAACLETSKQAKLISSTLFL